MAVVGKPVNAKLALQAQHKLVFAQMEKKEANCAITMEVLGEPAHAKVEAEAEETRKRKTQEHKQIKAQIEAVKAIHNVRRAMLVLKTSAKSPLLDVGARQLMAPHSQAALLGFCSQC